MKKEGKIYFKELKPAFTRLRVCLTHPTAMAGQMTLVEPLVVGDRIQVEIEVCDASGNALAECEQYTGRGEGPFQHEQCVNLFTCSSISVVATCLQRTAVAVLVLVGLRAWPVQLQDDMS